MNESEEHILAQQLMADEGDRDRSQYVYTVDALIEGGITPTSIYPQSNKGARDFINGQADYNAELVDDEDISNEFHKGTLFPEQQDIILRNNGKEPLCEALKMRPCLKRGCVLYNSSLGPPVCREFKIAFKK